MFNFLIWKDHAVTPSKTYNIVKNDDGTYNVTRAGKVVQQGTNMSAANFNRLEVGLHDVSIAVKIAQTVLQWLGLRTDKLETTTGSHTDSIAAINTLNTKQDTRLTALEKTTAQHTTDISGIKTTDTTQNNRLSVLEPEVAAEVKEITLTAGNDPWPFCAKDTAVGLSTTRKNTNYTVDVSVKSYTGGRLGDIVVKDKLANGFKLRHDGSAKTVVVSVKVTGGTK